MSVKYRSTVQATLTHFSLAEKVTNTKYHFHNVPKTSRPPLRPENGLAHKHGRGEGAIYANELMKMQWRRKKKWHNYTKTALQTKITLNDTSKDMNKKNILPKRAVRLAENPPLTQTWYREWRVRHLETTSDKCGEF